MRPAGNIVLEYFQLQRANIDHYLRLCVEGTEAESVHRLRVSIKKIRTIYKLAGILLPEASKDHREELRRLRKLFKLAGAIRDAHVIQKLATHFEKTDQQKYREFKAFLRERERQSVVKFFRRLENLQNSLNSIPANQSLESSLKHLPYPEIAGYLLLLLEKRYAKVRKILHSEPGEKELHRGRMLLKQMRYLLSVARNKDPQFDAFNLSMSGLKTTEALLGEWHDHVIFLEALQDFQVSDHLPDKSMKKRYNNLFKSVNKAKKDLHVRISESFAGYLGV